MVQLIWFLIKLGLLVAGAIWLAARPGQVDIQWMNYEITIHFGFFLLLFFVLLLLTIGLTRFSLFFTGLPGRRKYKKTIKNNEKGLEALTLSLSSASAGNYGHAQFQADRALKLLPGSQPLPLLLKAGSLRKQGKFEKADETLKDMLSHPEGAVLAARALVSNAVEQNNVANALTYARTAERDYKGKDNDWLLTTLYELEAKAGNWCAADQALAKAIKKKAVSKEKADKDFIAIVTERARQTQYEGDEDKTVRLLKAVLKKDPAFSPAVTILFDIYVEQNKLRAACNILKKAWSIHPHPQFISLWKKAGLLHGKTDEYVNWLRKLTVKNRNHIESYIALAANNLRQGNYEYAKQDLEAALEIEGQRRIFKLLITLSEKTGASEASIRQRLEEMTEAKADPAWVCTLTGQVYNEWTAVVPPHNTFNTLIWTSPDDIIRRTNLNDNNEFYDLLTAS